MSKGRVTKYSGEYISDIPNTAGIYAWYFSPAFVDQKTNAKVLSQIAKHAEVNYDLSINLRYGLKAISKSQTSMRIGNQSIDDVLFDNIKNSHSIFEALIESGDFPLFSRPLYIGIAKNLYKRVFDQHYKKLADYWDDRSNISTYMGNNPRASVQNVIERTGEPHSFALEARVREIPVRDLVVAIYEIPKLNDLEIGPDEEFEQDDHSQRRSLEQLLHLLTDPICGRK